MKLVDRRMLQSDAFAWFMEKDPVLRSTIVCVIRLDRKPDWDRLHARYERFTRLVPQLRQRVQLSSSRVGPPWWTADPSFELDYHLRHLQLAAPGDWSQVLEFARVAAMTGFDRDRPLWEFTVLDGLSDGGTALVSKMHHSLTDGIGGVQLINLMVDDGPEESDLGPLPDLPDAAVPELLPWSARSSLADASDAAAMATRLLRSAPSTVRTTFRHPLDAAKQALVTAESVRRMVWPVTHAESSLIGDRRTRRQLVTMDVSFAELRAAAKAAGGNVNDAYIAALAGGLSKYHERRGTTLSELRVTVPISIRNDDDPVGGNRITLVRMKVPAGGAEPRERIAAISAIATQWRNEPALQHTQEIAFSLNLLPRAYISGMLKRVELLASNVPGLTTQAWLSGAKVLAFYPFGPTIGSAMNATLMSYNGLCNIGVNIDPDAIDEPAALISCLHESFAEILALGAVHPHKKVAPKKAAPKKAAPKKAAPKKAAPKKAAPKKAAPRKAS